ncbi:MAG TPA: hypothetical protein VIH42_00610, partial [Thermoguttaceae bacterium]
RFYWVRRYRWLKMRGIDPDTAGYDYVPSSHALRGIGSPAVAGLLAGRGREPGRKASGNGAPTKIVGP